MLERYLVQSKSPLIRVLPAEMWIERVLWLAAPVDMFARRRVRVVWDFLRGVVAAEPEPSAPPIASSRVDSFANAKPAKDHAE